MRIRGKFEQANDGAVLKFNLLDFPGSIEAHRTVFYQDKRRLGLVVTAVPPWGADQISLVPLGRRGD
jgi:hypothetical protein